MDDAICLLRTRKGIGLIPDRVVLGGAGAGGRIVPAFSGSTPRPEALGARGRRARVEKGGLGGDGAIGIDARVSADLSTSADAPRLEASRARSGNARTHRSGHAGRAIDGSDGKRAQRLASVLDAASVSSLAVERSLDTTNNLCKGPGIAKLDHLAAALSALAVQGSDAVGRAAATQHTADGAVILLFFLAFFKKKKQRTHSRKSSGRALDGVKVISSGLKDQRLGKGHSEKTKDKHD